MMRLLSLLLQDFVNRHIKTTAVSQSSEALVSIFVHTKDFIKGSMGSRLSVYCSPPGIVVWDISTGSLGCGPYYRFVNISEHSPNNKRFINMSPILTTKAPLDVISRLG